jgi:hypothetical protein
MPMLERHIRAHGTAPRQEVADGGFARRANLTEGEGVRRARHGLPQKERPYRPRSLNSLNQNAS